MREDLNYPQIDKQKLDIVKELIDRIAEPSNGDCSYALNELNCITGKSYSELVFVEYWGWTDLDMLAERVLTPEPPYINDLTRDEMKEIVSIVQKCLMLGEDNKADYYMELLHKSLPLVNVFAYMKLDDDEATIVDNMINASANSIITL